MDELWKAMEKKYGLKVSTGDKIPVPTRLATGSLALDIGLRGGFPTDRCTFINGRQSVAKTAICYKAIAKSQRERPEKPCGWVCSEPFDKTWAEINGVDVSKLYVARPEDGEEAINVYDALLGTRDFSILVLDSIGQLAPGEEVEEGSEGSHMTNRRAKMVKRFLLKIGSRLQPTEDKENECACLLINHIYDSLDKYVPYVIAGGRAVMTKADLMITLQRKDYIWEGKEKESQKIGIEVGVKIEKDKQVGEGMPFTFRFFNQDGWKGKAQAGTFDNIDAVINLGQLTEYAPDKYLIDRAGAWYTINPTGDRAMGREKLWDLIYEKNLAEQMGILIQEHYHD